jgi:hypothetical protein
VDARRQSFYFALAGGAAVGAVALCARYAPVRFRSAPIAEPLPPARAVTSASTSLELAASAQPDEPTIVSASTLPIPPSERFASPPEVARACPADMTLVDGNFCPTLEYVCIRHTEGGGHGCAEYERGRRCTAEPDHRRYCIDRYEWPNRIGENPLVYVDWNEAKALCAGAGKRLCRRSEWILACEGPKRLPFPWGFVRQPSPCNIDRAPISFDVSAMMTDATRESELARLWQADRIGSHPDCVSAFGAYDQAGNVDEWTDDLADDPNSQNPSTLNGGYWGPVRDTCRLTTKKHGPTFKFYQVGFRCCGDTIDGVVTPPPKPFVETESRPSRGKGRVRENDPYPARGE